MRTRLAALFSASCVALLFSAASATTASAQAGAAKVCKDGTTSTATGKGACSGHGGVDTKASAAAANAAKKVDKTAAKAETKVAKTATKAEAKVAKTETKAESKIAPKQVKCTDGTMSKGGRGACSGHGGIAKPGK